jgi:hypothetical protein
VRRAPDFAPFLAREFRNKPALAAAILAAPKITALLRRLCRKICIY